MYKYFAPWLLFLLPLPGSAVPWITFDLWLCADRREFAQPGLHPETWLFRWVSGGITRQCCFPTTSSVLRTFVMQMSLCITVSTFYGSLPFSHLKSWLLLRLYLPTVVAIISAGATNFYHFFASAASGSCCAEHDGVCIGQEHRGCFETG